MQFLDLEFSIEGDQQLRRILDGVSKNLKNWTPEFKRTGKYLLKTFKENFGTQGRRLEAPWQKLKTSTVLEKIRLGYLAAGPLVRTGRMKNAFTSRPGKDQVVISNLTPYFKYHQSNKPRAKLPRRVMMRIVSRDREQIVKFFDEAVKEKLGVLIR